MSQGRVRTGERVAGLDHLKIQKRRWISILDPVRLRELLNKLRRLQHCERGRNHVLIGLHVAQPPLDKHAAHSRRYERGRHWR